MVTGVRLPMAVQVTIDTLHRGELLRAHGALVFLVGMGLVDVGQQRVLVDKDLGAVEALQVGLLGELGVAGEHVLLQLLSLAEGVLAIVTHEVVFLGFLL